MSVFKEKVKENDVYDIINIISSLRATKLGFSTIL